MERIHVLHVDDEPDFADLAATYLEREDEQFAVETAESADDGLARLRPTVDCIVSDYDMPGRNGIEFLETVRERYPELPFILFTGKGSEEVASEAVSAGVTDYLQKDTGTSQYTVLANRIRNAVEKYRTQRELADRQQRLNLFFEQSPLGVIEWDEEFRVTRANESATDILGYSEADLIGESWERIVPESDREAVDRRVSDLLENKGGYHSVNDNVRGDGQRITCEWHNRVVTDEDDEVVSIFSQFQDVTERTTRQRELEAQVTAMEAASNGIAILDHDEEFVYMNQSHASIYGFEDPDELLGETWRALYDAASIPRFEEEILPALDREGRWHGEMTVTTAAGRTLRQELTLTRLDDGRVVCVVRDITDRVELESELTTTVERYETLVENFPEGGVFLYDESHECVLAGGNGLSNHGLSPEDVVGSRPSDRYPPEIADELEERIRAAFEGERGRFEQTYRGQHYRVWTLPVGDDETADHVMAVSQEITDRVEREQAIEDLHGTARAFIAAETAEEIADITVDAARNILDLPASSVHLYDEAADSLPPAAWTDRVEEIVGTPPTFSGGSSLAWEVFETGEPRVYDDVSTAPGRLNPDTDVGSQIVLPLGEHGVFLIGSESADAFDETDESLARTLATHATSALTRITHEQELREERIFVEQALDTLPDIFYVIEPDGTLREWNDRLSDVVGYSDEEIADMQAVEFVPEEERGRIADTIEEAATTGWASAEAHVLTADGERIPYEFAGGYLSDPDGNFNGLVGIGRDISERRQRQQELEEANTILRTILENLPAGVLVEKSNREIHLANETLYELLDISPSPDLVGRDCETAADELKELFADPDGFVRGIEERIDERDPVRHEELDLADGRTLERDYVPYTLPDGEANLWIYRDITERKRREDALEQLHEATRDLMAASTTEEVAEVGSETALQVLDLPMNGILLFDADDELLEPLVWTDEIETELGGPPPSLPLEGSVAGRVYRTGTPQNYTDVHEADEAFNPETPFRSELHISLGDHGVFLAGSMVVDDFDATDEALAQVLAANIEAALDRVEQRAALQRERDRLDEFANVVSHDLRNPLSVAVGRLELAQRECDCDYLDDVERAHDRMASLIDDLLTLARENETTTETEAVDLTTTIGACWQNVETADATLVVETGGSIHADQGRLRQLLENLIRNAVEHGGDDVTVTVGSVTDGFYVADDGRGIPDAERDEVFDAGYSTTRDGTGFGLNIVEEIAEAHGWTVDVTESDGGGAKFVFTGVTPADS